MVAVYAICWPIVRMHFLFPPTEASVKLPTNPDKNSLFILLTGQLGSLESWLVN
jgi:hypothetical protein